MGTTVIIEEKAFLGVLLAAVEAFPGRFYGERKPKGATAEGEVHGLLFGQRIQRNDGDVVFNVTLTVPNQIVLERTHDGISVAAKHINKIREAIELFPAYSLLGFFHSHPYPADEFKKCSSVEPSETDRDSAISSAEQEEEEMLDLIFSITRLKRPTWILPQFPKPYLIHASCGVYKYTLACYSAVTSEHEESYGAVDNLICTTAAGLQA
ncbi:MPN domain-containing protein [Trichlorobacter lovleyi]|uniref:JAB domain-containing protein n=1 Tax=Trichlorobacter lovleyi (strain ATCC BAA-1151 / DSM 17278 / SZ) TaxID=398767 RepID=B3E8P8_TRIL1|nr:hypothetical protein [Trichlorobacter lovleyi]ACD93751.1 hypothetical protein Glov_0013 [Trichlorobacter lovleyi SZ]